MPLPRLRLPEVKPSEESSPPLRLWTGGDDDVGRCVGATGGGSHVVGGGGVRVFASGVGQVEGVEIKTRRHGQGTWHLGDVTSHSTGK